MPDAALVVPELPHTATGKLLKAALRERYGNYYMDAAAAVPGPSEGERRG